MATGHNVHLRRVRWRKLLLKTVVAAALLLTTVYAPVGLEEVLGLDFGPTVYAAHSSSGGD